MSAAPSPSSRSDVLLPAVPSWQEAAVCKGRTDLFFPKRSERPEARERRERAAAMLCQKCPVRVPCQQDARENREYGFWGGESEHERHLAGFKVAAPVGLYDARKGRRRASLTAVAGD
ncbi:MAG: WhiB family transcriptional regulator [Actinomycetota bacterium]